MDSSLFVLSLVIVVFVNSARSVNTQQDNGLHTVMDVDELAYYFGENFNATSASSNPKYEIVYLPKHLWQDGERPDAINFTINTQDRPILLNLKRNINLSSDKFLTVEVNEHGSQEMEANDTGCHLLHRDREMTAALSNCNHEELIGLIFTPNSTLEIKPLTHRLKSIVKPGPDADATVPHLIRHVDIGDALQMNPNHTLFSLLQASNVTDNSSDAHLRSGTKRPNIEVGVFFDEAAYKTFAPYFKGNSRSLRDMLLAYMNGIQAIYHHPSLKVKVDITIVYLELMKTQPRDLPHFNGERSELLDSFCKYQKEKNPKLDSDPKHWDMALYISGLDFYAYENGRQVGLTMGLATVGGVCFAEYSCVIAEFGSKNVFGRPYPSAGFTSVYILAHEIGHSLGMHHDASGNNCPKEGFIMSPTRGTNGEAIWSTCSSDIVSRLQWAKCLYDESNAVSDEFNAWKFKGFPGQTWTAKKQCEILLTDKDAYVATHDQHNLCHNLHCRTPNRSGYYLAGPGLDGTVCEKDKWCQGGECVPKSAVINHFPNVKGGWSDWKSGECKSGCITNSQGSQTRTRECNNPVPVNTDEGCQGLSYDISLCNDFKLCGKASQKISPTAFASKKCAEYSEIVLELDPQGTGLQASHEFDRVWMGCAIFCKKKDSSLFYTPRFELNDLGVAPYFPDGTLCHTENKQRFYCRHHHCLPEKFQLTKTPIWQFDEDILITANTRSAFASKRNKNIEKYFSIDNKGKPLLTKLSDSDLKFFDEANWTDRDYINL